MKKVISLLSLMAVVSTPVSADRVLDTLVVTPTSSEQSQVVTPVSLSVISPDEIAATGASSLVDVLRTQIGIQIKDNIGNGSRASISMRGFGSNSTNNVLIVVDGRKLNNPTLEAPLLSSIALKDIERIEIIQGSGGVLYGDQAVGGVINIITKKPEKNQLDAKVAYGTHDLKVYQIGAALKLDNGFSYRITGEVKTANNYRDNNESNYDNVFMQLNYDREWGSISLERSYIDDKLNLPGFLSNEQIENRRTQVGFASSFDHRVNIERVGVSLYLGDHFTLENDFSLRDSNGDNANAFSSNRQDTRVKTYSSKLLGAWETDHGDILLTSGYEDIKSDYQNTGFANADWVNAQESFYSQLVYPLSSSISGTAGYRRTSAKDNDLIDAGNNRDSEEANEIGFNYTNKNSRYFIRRAESFRFGNADENGLTLTDVKFLKPQKSDSYEVGYQYNDGDSRFNVTAYDLRVDREIYFDSLQRANINLDSSTRRGLLLEVDHQLNQQLALGGGYSFTRAYYNSGSFQGNDVPDVPKQTVTFYIDYELTSGLRLYFDGVYIGERFPSSDNENSSEKLGGYTRFNFNASWQREALGLNLRVNNLTAKEYTGLRFSSGGYPAPERTVELSLFYQLH